MSAAKPAPDAAVLLPWPVPDSPGGRLFLFVFRRMATHGIATRTARTRCWATSA